MGELYGRILSGPDGQVVDCILGPEGKNLVNDFPRISFEKKTGKLYVNIEDVESSQKEVLNVGKELYISPSYPGG